MSKQVSGAENQQKHQQRTVDSYVTGFLLSLLFTAIPYSLVVTHVVSGNALLATIIGFAVIQMIVQVVFFLHLGRERGPRWQLVFFVGTVGVIIMVVGASLWIMHHLKYNMAPAQASKNLVEKEGIYQLAGKKTGACEGGSPSNHIIIISDGTISPYYTKANLCDTLTFVNQDGVERSMTFATHPDHGSYAGESDLTVRKGRNKTITLNESGDFQFHDHHDPKAAGSFTVVSK